MADAQIIVQDNRAVVTPFGSELLTPLVESAAAFAAQAEASADSAGLLLSPAALNATTVVGPTTPLASGTAATNGNVFYWSKSLSDIDRWLTALETGMGSGGGAGRVIVALVDGAGKLDLVTSTAITLAAGRTTQPLAIQVPAGALAGLLIDSGTLYYTPGAISGGESYFFSSPPTTDTSKLETDENGIHFRMTFAGDVLFKSSEGYDAAAEAKAEIGEVHTFGWPDVENGGSNLPAGFSITNPTPEPFNGIVSRVTLGGNASGTAKVFVVSVVSMAATMVRSVDVSIVDGVAIVPLMLQVSAGQHIGISGQIAFQNGDNPEGIEVYYSLSLPTTSTGLEPSTDHRYEVQFEVSSGLRAEIAALEAGGNEDGLAVLADADATGEEDATAVFANGRNAHPFPYVRPGAFQVTAMPGDSGDGFWGPGVVRVDGAPFFLPSAPSRLNLRDGLRQGLSEHIAGNDVLTFIGDSIAHWAYAADGDDHWISQLTAFGNLGIAPDEPTMTAFQALTPGLSYTPAFYGVTLSGTVTDATGGPLEGRGGITLASGASMTFTGTYEQVDVFYRRAASQGSLAFAINGGSPYFTLNAAGATDDDRFSAASATGQTTSATYTLTASGGPVTITGLNRLGVKAAGTPPRLRTMRAAHSSFTFADFLSGGVASILKQATYAGGEAVPVLCLGINDSLNLSAAQIATDVTAVLDALEAGGVTTIFGCIPPRPSSDWTYSGGRSYDTAVAAIRRVYRARGVTIVPLDMLNWDFQGLYNEDGIHFGAGAGQRMAAQMVIEAMAGR